MTHATMPVDRAELETTDIGRAHDLLSRAYVDHEPRLSRARPDFRFHTRTATAGEVALDRLKYVGAVESTADPFASITTAVVVDGWYTVTGRQRYHRFTAGDAFLVPLGTPLAVSWDSIDLQNVRFPLAMAARAARRLGVETADFRFDGPAPVSPRMNQHWIATVNYLVRAFTGPHPAVAHPLVYAGAVNALAAAAVAVFPNTTMTVAYVPGAGRVPPAAVRRATAYIDEHAAEPITLEDIAAAAQIGVRGLQAAFARHGDIGPMGHLRRVRMERAHRELQHGDPARGDTVAAIARRWGFGAPGRFAVEYRKAYGQAPSRTLRT